MTILPSDDAFGIISFSPDSLNRSVREGSGSSVSLTVQRTRGVLGPSTVFWEVSGDGAVDVENTNGFVVLAENTNSTQITIRIKDDVVCIKVSYTVSLCKTLSRFDKSCSNVIRSLCLKFVEADWFVLKSHYLL